MREAAQEEEEESIGILAVLICGLPPGVYCITTLGHWFRVPLVFMKEILVSLCIEHNVFDTKNTSRTPIEFKIMVVLRVMGRGIVADVCSEISNVCPCYNMCCAMYCAMCCAMLC